MDFFALPNQESARGNFYSLIGVGGGIERIRALAREWLEFGPARIQRGQRRQSAVCV
jgi:hypothetical protein